MCMYPSGATAPGTARQRQVDDVNIEANTTERVARLEGAYEHLATKADIQSAKVWIILAAVIQAIISAGIGVLVSLTLRSGA